MSALEAKRELEEAIASGSAAPEESPKKLPIESIREFQEVFQPRGPAGFASDAHIRDLARTPKGGYALDPVAVFWVGNGWAVIDGHHRLRAYRLAGWQDAIPVFVVSGSVDQAMAYAGRANSGEKLPMSNPEKKALAWKYATHTALSKAQIVRASGMSDGFMARMFRIRTILRKDKGIAGGDLAQMSWRDAQNVAAGTAQESEDIDREAWLEQQAQDMAARILKALGKRGHATGQHEVLARALEIYDRRLPDALREFWNEERGELEQVWQSEDPNGEF